MIKITIKKKKKNRAVLTSPAPSPHVPARLWRTGLECGTVVARGDMSIECECVSLYIYICICIYIYTCLYLYICIYGFGSSPIVNHRELWIMQVCSSPLRRMFHMTPRSHGGIVHGLLYHGHQCVSLAFFFALVPGYFV